MRVLDLFCGAGMAAEGYAAAGHEVFGVDIDPQPDYQFPFYWGDALRITPAMRRLLIWADVIHASPPCQLFTRAKHLRDAQGHESSEKVDLLTPTLAMLQRMSGRPWVVENVEGAKSLMPGAVKVCGSAFGLEVQRHRLFLSNLFIVGTECRHDTFPIDPVSGKPRPWGVYHVPGDSIPQGGRTAKDAEHGSRLFGMDRVLPWESLKQGFPPDYTKWVGRQVSAVMWQ